MLVTTHRGFQPLAFHKERWLLCGLMLLFVAVSVQYYFKIDDAQRSAILRWRPQIQQLYDVNIYERFTYPNPPIMALLLKPVIELSPIVAGLTWFYLKVAMTLLTLMWVFQLVETKEHPFPLWAKAVTVLLSLRPIMGDLTHGNVNLFILFLVVGALYAYHRHHDLLAGIVLALAIACKVTPALFIPYFIWKRAWKLLAGSCIGLVLFVVVVPGIALGMSRNITLFSSWYDCMVKPYVAAGEVTSEHLNQSLPGLLYRWFTVNPSTVVDGVPTEYRTLAELDPFWIKVILRSCMAAFAVLIVFACRTPTRSRAGWRMAAEFSLVLLGMLLFSERTWKHHCVTLVLPFAVITYCLATCSPGRVLQAYLIGSLAAATLLMTTTSSGISESWDYAARMAHADGAYVWAYLILIAALVVLLRQPLSTTQGWTSDRGEKAYDAAKSSA